MNEFINDFEAGITMMDAPKQFIGIIKGNPEYRKNPNIMSLIKVLMEGFKRYLAYAVLSGIKGLSPFRKDKDMVDAGYYDYRKTAEFKTNINRLGQELGMKEDYLNPDIQAKYKLIKYETDIDVEGMTITTEGFFQTSTGDVYDLVDKDISEALMNFVSTNEKYKDRVSDIILKEAGPYILVNASEPAVLSFLEKYKLGRDVEGHGHDRKEKELDNKMTIQVNIDELQDGECFVHGDIQYIYQDNHLTAAFYKGTEQEVEIPSHLVIQGREVPVTEIGYAAFRNSQVTKVSMDASILNPEKYNPMCLRNIGDVFPEVDWRNLDASMEAALAENRKWAETISKPEKAAEKELKAPDLPKEAGRNTFFDFAKKKKTTEMDR